MDLGPTTRPACRIPVICVPVLWEDSCQACLKVRQGKDCSEFPASLRNVNDATRLGRVLEWSTVEEKGLVYLFDSEWLRFRS